MGSITTKHYSKDSPPSSIEEASQAHHQLQRQIRELDLKFVMKKQATQIAYKGNDPGWRRRINEEKKIVENQITFLKQWISKNRQQSQIYYYLENKKLITELSLMFSQGDFSDNEARVLFFSSLHEIPSSLEAQNRVPKSQVQGLLCQAYQVFYDQEEDGVVLSPYQCNLKKELLEKIFHFYLRWNLKEGVSNY